MRFTTRFLIAFLAAVGAGTLAFAVAGHVDRRYLDIANGFSRDAYFLAAAVLPTFIAFVAVFRKLGQSTSSEYPFDD